MTLTGITEESMFLAHLKLPVSLHGFLLVDETGSRVAKETGLY